MISSVAGSSGLSVWTSRKERWRLALTAGTAEGARASAGDRVLPQRGHPCSQLSSAEGCAAARRRAVVTESLQ